MILSPRRMLPDEDAAGMELAEKIMENFEDDGRLNEHASATSCDLTLVEPFIVQYGDAQQGAAYYALRCLFTVRETTA